MFYSVMHSVGAIIRLVQTGSGNLDFREISRTQQLNDLADRLVSEDTTCTIIGEVSVHIFETDCLPTKN